MADLTEQDRYHLRLLARAYAIAGWLGVGCLAVIVVPMLLRQVGSLGPPEFLVLVPVLGVLGVTSLSYLFAGYSLARLRHRGFVFFVAVVSCLMAPLGTVLGVCTMLVLSRISVRDAFRPRLVRLE